MIQGLSENNSKMMRLTSLLWLADGTSANGPGNTIWIGLILMLVVFYGVMLSGSRKEKRKRQDMLNSIGKNDRILTIGGIIGSVVSVNGNEVTVKVDESANVKITFTRSAIQKILTEDDKLTDNR